jgi:stalled ribosome alternative rescue factor ArfA
VAVLMKKRGEYNRKGKKSWTRLFSAKGLSVIILAMALLKALVELASAIASLFA